MIQNTRIFKQIGRISAIALSLLVIVSVPCGSQTSSKKDKKQQKERAEKDAILDILNTRNFTVSVQTVRHDVTGAEYDLTIDRRTPEVLFRPNGIKISLPYYTGNTPLDGISGNEDLGDGQVAFMGATGAPVYANVWLDWSFPYPKDYEISEDRHTVKLKFTTDMGSSETYFCEFIFSRKNCEFYIDCKSFTRTKYMGSLNKFE